MSTLFIVDDEEDILIGLNYFFERKGIQTSVFSNSKSLFQAIARGKPDVILLDINLNGEDGRLICRQIKHDSNTMCPIILFSANPVALATYADYSADRAVEKPFVLPHLLQLVTSFIRKDN